MAQPTLLEGCPITGDLHALIPDCPRLDREVQALHHLARTGAIPTDVADRQLNTYLLAAVARNSALVPRHWLVMPITDAPHPGLLPDLGQHIHRLLARNPLPGSLSAALEQGIPSLRHAPRHAPYTDSQPVLLNLVLGLVLGLFPGGTVKRPGFSARARLFGGVHSLLTSAPEAQTAFCRGHPDVVQLACMEYVARVLPATMPAQLAHLEGRDPSTPLYFRRISALCDELRQALDGPADDWAHIQRASALAVERVSRLKKAGGGAQTREPCPAPALPASTAELLAHWNAPCLHGSPSTDEYRLLGQGLGLHGPLLSHIQREVQVYSLPGNLRRMQLAGLTQAVAASSCRAPFMRTRQHVCMVCALTHRSIVPGRLRLDTLRQTLVCSTCAGGLLLSIDMLGRILCHRQQAYFLCPGCTRVQPYHGEAGEHIWQNGPTTGSGACSHQAPARQRPKQRDLCRVCHEPAAHHAGIQRVDHHTGQMLRFYFCARHMPRPEQLAGCANARQLSSACCDD